MLRFYGHFAAAFGTACLVLLGFSLLSRSHINVDQGGLCAFSFFAVLYAAIRTGVGHEIRRRERDELDWLRQWYDNRRDTDRDDNEP